MPIKSAVRDWLAVHAIVLAFYAIFSSSCGNTRPLTYLQGSFDTAKLSLITASEPVIRKGDLLSIIVFSDNPEATKIYNQSVIITAGSSGASGILGNTPSSPGYLVDENGNIVFQQLGLIHVENLTRTQLKDTLDERFKDLLTHPYYSIRFVNYKFTMLGEIGRPGQFSIPGDRINLLEALALAGDMTFYGRRDNVMVIRENNGKREWARLDLTKPEVMASPYFYLQQNDLVIVEQNRKKVAASDQITSRNVSLAATIVSTIAILYTVFRK